MASALRQRWNLRWRLLESLESLNKRQMRAFDITLSGPTGHSVLRPTQGNSTRRFNLSHGHLVTRWGSRKRVSSFTWVTRHARPLENQNSPRLKCPSSARALMPRPQGSKSYPGKRITFLAAIQVSGELECRLTRASEPMAFIREWTWSIT